MVSISILEAQRCQKRNKVYVLYGCNQAENKLYARGTQTLYATINYSSKGQRSRSHVTKIYLLLMFTVTHIPTKFFL